MVLTPGAQPLSIAQIVKGTDAPLWALIDGVACPELKELVEQGADAACLYRAETVDEAPHAPWLLRVDPNSPLIEDLEILPGDRHWGFVFSAQAGMPELRRHFRKFTMLWTPAQTNAPVYFRFYDPRILSDALIALRPEHAASLMAPVSRAFVPVSPMLGGWTGLSPLVEGHVYRGHFLELALPQAPVTARPAAAFQVSEFEYAKMSDQHRMRSHRKLARDLRFHFRAPRDEIILKAAELAPERAKEYGFDSVTQVFLFARCMVRFGPEFDTKNKRAAEVLTRNSRHSWQRSDALEDWFSKEEMPLGAGGRA